MTHPLSATPVVSPPSDETALVHLVGHDATTESLLATLLDGTRWRWRAHADPAAFLNDLDPDTAGCALVDPRHGGLALQERLQARSRAGEPGPPLVFVAGAAPVTVAVRAMRAGAVDFLCAPVDDRTLVRAVYRALERDRHQRHAQRRREHARRRLDALTPRERQTLDAVVDGHSNKSIARALSISPKTVELHRARMMHKLGQSSVAGVVRLYLSATGEAAGP